MPKQLTVEEVRELEEGSVFVVNNVPWVVVTNLNGFSRINDVLIKPQENMDDDLPPIHFFELLRKYENVYICTYEYNQTYSVYGEEK